MSTDERNSNQSNIVAKAMTALLVAQRLQRNKLTLGADYTNTDSLGGDEDCSKMG